MTVASLLAQLEARRGRPAVFVHTPLAADVVPVLYEALRATGHRPGLDVVLSTGGGGISVTRQLAVLLRSFTDHLAVIVPYRARSAGTLLCLAADELVLGPLAELGPLDSQMNSAGPPAGEQPGTISAEDVRAFPLMAADWFGVERPEDRLQVLALLATRIFPTSLASFYRFDALIRQTALELLTRDAVPAADRERIVERLVAGYHSHDTVLTRADVRELGLPVTDADAEVETLIWQLYRAAPRTADARLALAGGEAVGLVESTVFRARNLVLADESGGIDVEWHVDEESR